ncbi:hypothetical protein CLV91_2696 [Maribacter vaceletii]|uniref:Tetratricopeptide repeat protein n=1 Tax=Maribacter vaceletii TaxID=1206816 RepID=A0A495DTG1_9FLAO|nr:tetratricopeptide repeat protein [Maribacter vaceletii]RKR07935.1 hypothetical protein CLV91_2696 [Maribacter vaceletii]
MKHISLLFLILSIYSCNTEKENSITNTEDYNQYLHSTTVKTTSKYFELWNSKIQPDSMQLLSFGIVGSEYNRYFKNTGDIKFLKKAEQSLKKAVSIAATGRAGYNRALARNYISQHRFKEALVLAKKALEIGNGVDDTYSLLFDIHMELGNYEEANNYLKKIKNFSNFGYLIRLAKWNDHLGNLDITIQMMEKATSIAVAKKDENLILWSYTNLADYYGHAGELKKSYNHYLKSLELDPNNAYAKKGIAWIVFSHERNPKEALRILDSVTQDYKAPDYYILKSEIAEYLGNEREHLYNLDEYFSKVTNPDYGDMYNTYTINLYLENTQQYIKAITLAKKEVENRPTPESYGYLAYSYLKNGENKKALQIVTNHIENKTFEPNILLQAAEVYKNSGQEKKALKLKQELLDASYELGPATTLKIEML